MTLSGVPGYILSNIDSTDIHEATAFYEIKVRTIWLNRLNKSKAYIGM
jgi:hypothetical protein